MERSYYIPIYKWGDDPDSCYGNTSGTTLYCELNDLYGFEPDAIGYFQVYGNMPTKNQFKKLHEQKFELTESQIENWLKGSLTARGYDLKVDDRLLVEGLIEDLKSQ